MKAANKSYLYAILTVFIWSTMATIVKMMLVDIPSLQMLSISSFCGVGFLLVWNASNGSIRKMKSCALRDYAAMGGLGFLGIFVYSALYYYGIANLSAQEACIANYLWPMMLVLFSCIILKEKLTMLKAVAMICSFIGIVILSAGSGETGNGNTIKGLVSCITAAACYGLFSVLNKKVDYDQNISMMMVWLVTAVCSLVLGLLTETWVPIRGVQWLGILWTGVVVHALAYLLWAVALNSAENTAQIANLAYLTPFLSLIVSAVLLKEKIQPRAFIALLFIIGGIVVQSLYEHRPHRKSKKP